MISYNASGVLGPRYKPYPVSIGDNVAVKVICNEPIEVGDLLTTSDIPGMAMKCDANCKLGTVVGKALENFSRKEGKILVLITLQ